jgi:tripartite-type tricarboxylate transporter receptor subunit TctC
MVARRRTIQLLWLSLLVFSSGGWAQNYPSRPVRIVVGFGAGGPDTTARIIAQQLAQQTGQSFIVDNRPGAGGSIGADIVAKSAPDGYTLLVSSASFAVNPSIYKKLPFDAIRDFTPVSQLCDADGHILAVTSALPAQNVRDLIALAKRPGANIAYGSNGVGATGHLVGALFNSRIGANMVHVPYKGAGATLNALVAGEIQIAFINATLGLPLLKAGRIRALAYDSPVRAPYLPDVPTMAEAGAPPTGMKTSWHGMFAPARLPPAVLARLEAEIRKVMAVAEVRDRFDKLELNPIGSTSAEFRPILETAIKRLGEAVRLAGIQPE